MENMRIRFLFFLVVSLISMCAWAQPKSAGEYTYSCECMGTEADGSETILAWGNGRNRLDAAEQAKKNAVQEILFNGIKKGNGGCSLRPLISEVNARLKYEVYFNEFFADKGPYMNFVSLKDERIDAKITRDRQEGRKSVNNSAVVRVLRSELKNQLIKDKILKP
jgi:hypothetical protein